MLLGHVRAAGIRVSRARVRASINRVRLVRPPPPRKLIRRRVYSVKGPLSMWHIDGHHKLIRSGFIYKLIFMYFIFIFIFS